VTDSLDNCKLLTLDCTGLLLQFAAAAWCHVAIVWNVQADGDDESRYDAVHCIVLTQATQVQPRTGHSWRSDVASWSQ